MIFIESDVFTEDLQALLDDKEYSVFQQFLADHPDAGDLIRGTGGLRKGVKDDLTPREKAVLRSINEGW